MAIISIGVLSSIGTYFRNKIGVAITVFFQYWIFLILCFTLIPLIYEDKPQAICVVVFNSFVLLLILFDDKEIVNGLFKSKSKVALNLIASLLALVSAVYIILYVNY
ncbi:MAG: hypothetical protein AAGC88_07840 [Bacteroidota bacterium]